MLALGRRYGETIRIGDEITITVCDINSTQVRLGIEAPDDVVILREELYDADDAQESVDQD